MKKTTLLCVTLLLTACSAPMFKPRHTIERFETLCAHVPFSAYGSCIRSELERDNSRWRSDPHADLVDVYLAWLDAAGARVSDGRMEEADARLGAAEIKVRLKSIASERATNTSLQQQAATSRMLTGLAIMNAASPQPSAPITCQSVPTGLGTMTTRCN
jgi:hypothetical protein